MLKMQLAFDFHLRSDARLDNFIIGSNGMVIHALQEMVRGGRDQHCFVSAEKGDGLTHLLQAICHYAGEQGVENIYFPIKEVTGCGVSILNGLETVPLVCLDDMDYIAGDPVWEEALFHLFNRLRERGRCFILGAHHTLSACNFQLQDLISRLSWGATYHLSPLNDDSKLYYLQLNAKRRGFYLSSNTAKYLLNHYPRDMQTQLKLLEVLDALSLQKKHKITIPFIKAHLQLS